MRRQKQRFWSTGKEFFANLAARTDNLRNLEETFTYDHLNRLTDVWLNNVHTGHMAYDALGRMTDKRTDGQQVFSSAQHDYIGPDGQLRPHAISSATVEGNPFPTEQQDITYTMFDKVGTITQPYNNGLYTLSYAYGYNHQRRRIVENYGNAVFRKKIYGDHCEFVTENSYNSSSTFLTGPLGVFAVVEKKVNGVESVHYVLKDHLGSWTTITDANGNIVREQSFDAWGNMRDPDTWTGTVTQQPMFDRGFTGHEHLNSFGLINMNGRMYDPVMSSFLSVDNYVQNPDFSQNFNRYAYCLNNPLKYTDPSGEIHVLAVVAIGAAVTVITNGINNVLHGENFFHGAGQAAVTGGVQALFAHAIGESANVIGSVIKNQATAQLAKAGFQLVSHGTMGGMSTMSRGGKFWHGFVSSATASVMSTAINQTCIHFQLSEGLTNTAMIAGGALSGGISAKMAGGDFIDGLCNGLICVALNHALHYAAEGIVFVKGCMALGISCTGPIPEEMQNDLFLRQAQEAWYPDAPMDNVERFTVENVPQKTQDKMDAEGAAASTNGLYGSVSDIFTRMSYMYFNKNRCFESPFKLYITMGHEFVHVSQYDYLGSIGYTHSDFMKNNVLATMDHWAYNYESYLRGGKIQHGLSSNIPLYNELDYVNFKWHSNHNYKTIMP